MDQSFSETLTDARYHYHSIYDSQRWQELYADPGFHRHVAVAKQLGLVALRIIDSIVLPLNTTQYAYELNEYLKSRFSRTVVDTLFNTITGKVMYHGHSRSGNPWL